MPSASDEGVASAPSRKAERKKRRDRKRGGSKGSSSGSGSSSSSSSSSSSDSDKDRRKDKKKKVKKTEEKSRDKAEAAEKMAGEEVEKPAEGKKAEEEGESSAAAPAATKTTSSGKVVAKAGSDASNAAPKPSAVEHVAAEKEWRLRRAEKLKTGGVYMPPHKMRAAQAEMDKGDEKVQRMQWDALKKSINGLINKVNTSNIKNIVPEIFGENLVRGRGLIVRSVMKAQMASPSFTHVYAALAAVINTKMPEIGDLLLKRVIAQFQRAYRRNDKLVCIACTKFLAHLVNQQVNYHL